MKYLTLCSLSVLIIIQQNKKDPPLEQAVKWTDVKANIVVTQVAAPATNDPHKASLILMDCENEAQRSFFRTLVFDNCGSNQPGPPLMERIGTIR